MGSLNAKLPVHVPGKPHLTVLRPERRPTAARLGFIAAFDLLGQPVGVYSMGGSLLQRTAAFGAALEQPEVSGLVGTAVGTIARQRDVALRTQTLPSPVALPDRDCIIRASLYQPSDSPMVLVCIDSRTAIAGTNVSDEQIMKEFGLTPAELRVARHLASGEPNKIIASALGVSAHTARHHTERVFRKLGITSRAAVNSRLTRAGLAVSRPA
jgi:DNA-binding CsgD family transcriptional regulator